LIAALILASILVLIVASTASLIYALVSAAVSALISAPIVAVSLCEDQAIISTESDVYSVASVTTKNSKDACPPPMKEVWFSEDKMKQDYFSNMDDETTYYIATYL